VDREDVAVHSARVDRVRVEAAPGIGAASFVSGRPLTLSPFSIPLTENDPLALYPLLLEPVYKEKVWGGRSLERFGRSLPGGPDARIGESWELADLPTTSPSGGGGEGAHTRIRNGPLSERAIDDVLRDFREHVLGSAAERSGQAFPLLLKYLDASENLSVQVHPSAEYAAAHPGAHLKSEAWYIVDAEPGAKIYRGVREGTTPASLREAIETGTVDDLLVQVPAEIGACHYLPSGTCHALGAGIFVAEIQTPSDTTFRVYDWDRTDRELHVEQALECIDFGPVDTGRYEPGTVVEDGHARGRHLVDCEHFAVWEWTLSQADTRRFTSDELSVLMLVRGRGLLAWGSETAQTLPIGAGDTTLLPAALPSVELRADEELVLLEVTLPKSAT